MQELLRQTGLHGSLLPDGECFDMWHDYMNLGGLLKMLSSNHDLGSTDMEGLETEAAAPWSYFRACWEEDFKNYYGTSSPSGSLLGTTSRSSSLSGTSTPLTVLGIASQSSSLLGTSSPFTLPQAASPRSTSFSGTTSPKSTTLCGTTSPRSSSLSGPASPSSLSDSSCSEASSLYCPFCRHNGETAKVYRSHNLKSEDGKVSCPILYNYTCPICEATGDNAHTRSYCPQARRPDAAGILPWLRLRARKGN
ncbi:nanos homolog 1-like [Epinephelus fuscoguttatus]|uniref:nanos homolog 1-like n=1 Tax=Epinephelus fuscoguttatus TaxID=293821 RepID=UPI0020D0B86A|nr:nanos homolog 1-like [Epinephelus fuscoguttatus]